MDKRIERMKELAKEVNCWLVRKYICGNPNPKKNCEGIALEQYGKDYISLVNTDWEWLWLPQSTRCWNCDKVSPKEREELIAKEQHYKEKYIEQTKIREEIKRLSWELFMETEWDDCEWKERALAIKNNDNVAFLKYHLNKKNKEKEINLDDFE